mmetsp:Transcript_86913/g.137148  ORF Transcript_86913/g.137148 Transcript_86913/m.137148 type:complete len:80 (+) Transcript_86913:521-760(+)
MPLPPQPEQFLQKKQRSFGPLSCVMFESCENPLPSHLKHLCGPATTGVMTTGAHTAMPIAGVAIAMPPNCAGNSDMTFC